MVTLTWIIVIGIALLIVLLIAFLVFKKPSTSPTCVGVKNGKFTNAVFRDGSFTWVFDQPFNKFVINAYATKEELSERKPSIKGLEAFQQSYKPTGSVPYAIDIVAVCGNQYGNVHLLRTSGI